MILVDISTLPNFEVTCSDGNQYVLLPFKHLSDIPVVDNVCLTKEQYEQLLEYKRMYENLCK